MKLTIFTPTYNRAKFLERVYNSIATQQENGIEWLIVDDGSADNTEAVVNELIEKAAFPIVYVKKENGGKHTAHNVALENASGEWFMCLDSDDMLESGALKDIFSILPKCTGEICAVAAYKKELARNLLSDEFSQDEFPQGIYSLLEKYHGEYVFIFRTDTVKKYPYPVFPGERFSSECILYDKLEIDGYKALPYGRVLQVCEYQTDGLSLGFRKLLKNNPCGFQTYYLQRIALAKTLKQRFMHCVKYCAFRILCKFKAPKYKGKYLFLVFLSYPFGMLAALYYSVR